MKRKLKTALVLAFVAGLVVLFAHPAYRQGEPSLRGREAKDFTFTIDGRTTRLSDFRGKVVVLNFWESWCQPCRDEAQSLNALQQRIAPLGGVVLGVDAGVGEDADVDETRANYDAFLRAFDIDFPTYLDTSKHIAVEYGTSAYPETYIIDRNGRVDRKIIGPQDWTGSQMLNYLDSLLSAS